MHPNDKTGTRKRHFGEAATLTRCAHTLLQSCDTLVTPPRYTNGRVARVHSNGLINYAGASTAADGSDPRVAARVANGELQVAHAELEAADDANADGEQVCLHANDLAWALRSS